MAWNFPQPPSDSDSDPCHDDFDPCRDDSTPCIHPHFAHCIFPNFPNFIPNLPQDFLAIFRLFPNKIFPLAYPRFFPL